MREAIGIKRLQAPKHQEEFAEVPPWLTIMYSTEYFATCVAHPNTKKNELDRFCIDCLQALCFHCLSAHARHAHVKIRRYVYCEVINRQDLCKLFDCSGIQAYHTNKTKVIFLKQRPQQQQQQQSQQQQSQQYNSRDHSCVICQRNLQDATLYCSIACKVSAIYREENINDPISEKNEGLKRNINSKEKEDLPKSPPKRLRLRKGVPLRAPMF